ncbi:MAG: serine hydrolase [Oscillospiraceae bacterium]|nr:serine hydrolase [Oscillospiraceae bacterium]
MKHSLHSRRSVVRAAVSFLLCALLLVAGSGAAFAVDYHFLRPLSLTLYVGDRASAVRAYDANYENNIYLSLADLSSALDGTAKQFSFTYGNTAQDGEYNALRMGQPALTAGSGITQDSPASREEVWLAFSRNRIFVDGADRKYYTFREGWHDLYMSLVDVQLMLDVTLEKTGENAFRLYPERPFAPDYLTLEAEGYFAYLSSFVLGDADTGVILCALNHDEKVSIASTSKLMTYLLFAEAEQRGEVGYDTVFTISPHVEEVSRSADGMIFMEAGKEVPASELLDAMLVASSNEAAVAVAELVAGSEERFVSLMNSRAQELGLYSAEFYTPNGLPIFTDTAVPAKLQNRMSAYDLFRLSAYVLKSFPEITKITSQAFASMPSLSYTVANSNPLLFNMPGITGLKTGSTNRAGYCISASLPVTVGKETHQIILCLLGAETGADRGQEAEILLRFARNYYQQNGFPR